MHQRIITEQVRLYRKLGRNIRVSEKSDDYFQRHYEIDFFRALCYYELLLMRRRILILSGLFSARFTDTSFGCDLSASALKIYPRDSFAERNHPISMIFHSAISDCTFFEPKDGGERFGVL